jgi:hypothetical protein
LHWILANLSADDNDPKASKPDFHNPLRFPSLKQIMGKSREPGIQHRPSTGKHVPIEPVNTGFLPDIGGNPFGKGRY